MRTASLCTSRPSARVDPVVMECGLDDGGSSGAWGSVPSGVAKFTEACFYDRAGLGKSAPGPEPRTSTRIANDLHSLLQQAGCQAPYILVGHSFGGLHLRRFVDLYPEEVAGLVLVDPTPRELMVEPLKPEQIERLKAVGAPPGLIAEADGGVAASLSEWANLKPLPDVPVVVITSSPPKADASDLDKQRYESLAACHQGLVDMVSDGVHLTAAKAGHYIQLDEPSLVIDAIKQVFDKVSIKSE